MKNFQIVSITLLILFSALDVVSAQNKPSLWEKAKSKGKELMDKTKTEPTAEQTAPQPQNNRENRTQPPARTNTTNAQPVDNEWVGDKFPNVSVRTTQGREVNTHEYFTAWKYNVVVFGTRCGPDVRLVLDLSDNFECLDMDNQTSLTYLMADRYNSTQPDDEKLLTKNGAKLEIPHLQYWFDNLQQNPANGTKSFGKLFVGCPTTLIVSSDGEILYRQSGGSYDAVKQFITKSKKADKPVATASPEKYFNAEKDWQYLHYQGAKITEATQVAAGKDGTFYAFFVVPVEKSLSGKTILVKIAPDGKGQEMPAFNPPVRTFNDIATDANGHLFVSAYLGNKMNSRIIKWDGANWSELPELGIMSAVKLATTPDGRICAKGESANISVWNKDAWAAYESASKPTPCATSVSTHTPFSTKKTFAYFTDMKGKDMNVSDGKGNEYVAVESYYPNDKNGNYFQYSLQVKNEAEAINIGGLSEQIIDLLAVDAYGNLYANFKINKQDVLKMYDGEKWQSFSNLKGRARNIAFDSLGNIYVTGTFTNQNGEANFVAKYVR